MRKTKPGNAGATRARRERSPTGAPRARERATPEPSTAPPTILLVEDNSEDAFMIRLAFEKVGVKNPLVVVEDGEEAIRYLKGEGSYQDRVRFPIPQLILLDLYLPQMSGFDVLAWLRQQSNARHLPVIILTTSTYSPDVKRAYQLGANSFLTKPTDFIDLISEVKAMSEFWLNRPGSDPILTPQHIESPASR